MSVQNGKNIDSKKVEKILRKAESTLETALFGYQDLKNYARTNPARSFSGLKHVFIYGRSVTFVLQNLRQPLGRERFDTWYQPRQEAMKSDPMMKYFVEVRNAIEKEGEIPPITLKMKAFPDGILNQVGPPPIGAQGFILGDPAFEEPFRRSGWLVNLPNGEKSLCAIDLPSEVLERKLYFANLPVPQGDKLHGISIDELCVIYLVKLKNLVDDCIKEFTDS